MVFTSRERKEKKGTGGKEKEDYRNLVEGRRVETVTSTTIKEEIFYWGGLKRKLARTLRKEERERMRCVKTTKQERKKKFVPRGPLEARRT